MKSSEGASKQADEGPAPPKPTAAERLRLLESEFTHLLDLRNEVFALWRDYPRRATALARQAGENVCKLIRLQETGDHFPFKTMLQSMISWLNTGPPLPKKTYLANWLDAVMRYGNAGAHDAEEHSRYPSAEDVRLGLDSLKLAIEWYVERYRPRGMPSAVPAPTAGSLGFPKRLGKLPCWVKAAAFSRDSRSLAAGGSSGRISFWSVDPVAESEWEQGPGVSALAFCPRTSQMASGSSDGIVRLWESPKTPAVPLVHHRHEVRALAYHPGGWRLASGADDGSLVVWETADRLQPVFQARGMGQINTVNYSADSRFLVVGDSHGRIHCWACEPDGLPLRKTHEIPAGTRNVNALCFIGASATLLSGGDDGKVKRWDLDAVQPHAQELFAHGKSVVSLTTSVLAGVYAIGCRDGHLRLRGSDHLELASATVDEQLQIVALSPDGRWLATGGAEGEVRLRRVDLTHVRPQG